ncbi:MAG: hypothetical protein AAGH42_07450 [Pseudomonadota bacterium]
MNEIQSVQGSVGVGVNAPTTGDGQVQASRRRANLEQARRSASADQIAAAERDTRRRAERFRESTEIIQRVIGANTRVEIAEGDGPNPYTYRAIDINSGEVVSEWPPVQFAAMIEAAVISETSASSRGGIDLSGIALDETI